jgi:dTDP-4-amino-4,6-dideoxygalactose transaminase
MINIHEPKVTLWDKLQVLQTLSTNWIGKGRIVEQFEANLANYLNVEEIVSTTSCTQGLFEIFNLLKTVSNKRRVLIASISWIGIANIIRSNGFYFDYCDINVSKSISLDEIKNNLTDDTIAVVVQHYGGRPNHEIEEIVNFLKSKNIFIIEDCATILGAQINSKHVGTFGDFAVWSFDAMKTITSGDGGAVYCADKKLREQLKANLFLGFQNNSTTLSKSKNSIQSDWWILKPTSFGSRNIMNDISASLGLSQLQKLDEYIKSQNKVWEYYSNNIKNPLITLPEKSFENCKEVGYLFWIYSDHRDALAFYLKQNKIFSTFRYYPLHLMELHKGNKQLKITEEFYSKTLCIPCHKNLSKSTMRYIVKNLNEFKIK